MLLSAHKRGFQILYLDWSLIMAVYYNDVLNLERRIEKSNYRPFTNMKANSSKVKLEFIKITGY